MGETGSGPQRENPYAVRPDGEQPHEPTPDGTLEEAQRRWAQGPGMTQAPREQPGMTQAPREQPGMREPGGQQPGMRVPGMREHRLDLLRQARRAALLGALASIAAILLPPAGLLCGIAVIIMGARLAAPLRSGGVTLAGAVLPIVSGAFAAIVGTLLTGLMVVAGPELIDYRDCMSGANTQLAKQDCERQFGDQLEQRFFG